MSNSQIHYSKKLDMNYKIKHDSNNNKIVVFQDNINYNQKEMDKLKNISDDNLRLVHQIKNIFGGIVV